MVNENGKRTREKWYIVIYTHARYMVEGMAAAQDEWTVCDRIYLAQKREKRKERKMSARVGSLRLFFPLQSRSGARTRRVPMHFVIQRLLSGHALVYTQQRNPFLSLLFGCGDPLSFFSFFPYATSHSPSLILLPIYYVGHRGLFHIFTDQSSAHSIELVTLSSVWGME